MVNERLIKKVEVIYTALKRAVSSPTYLHSSNPKYKKCIEKFLIKMIEKYEVVSEERIVDYCILAFYYFRNQPKFTPHHIFGDKVMEYVEAATKANFYYVHRWLKNNNISKIELLNLIQNRDKHPLDQYVFIIAEEQTKKRKLNKEVGFALCQTSTTGWSPLSPTCFQCNFKEVCKKSTAKKYPELYRLRLTHDTSK